MDFLPPPQVQDPAGRWQECLLTRGLTTEQEYDGVGAAAGPDDRTVPPARTKLTP